MQSASGNYGVSVRNKRVYKHSFCSLAIYIIKSKASGKKVNVLAQSFMLRY